MPTRKNSSEPAERRRLEEEIREREANFNCFFNTIDDFLFVLDAEGRILQVNNTALRRLEYAADDLCGQSVLLVHPEERRAEAGQIVSKMLVGEVDSCLIPLITKSGKLISVETRITAGEWNGRPALFGVSKDISALKLSEEKLAKTFQATSALIAISTMQDGIYLDVNDAFLNTLGFERHEVIGKSSHELRIFQHEDTRSELMKLLVQDGFVRNQEVRIRTKTGEDIYGILSADSVDVAEGRILISTMTDLTKLKLAQKELQSNAARLELVMEASGAGVWDRNLETRDVFFDKRWKAMRGFSDDEIENTHNEWLDRLHPVDGERLQQALSDALQGNTDKFEIEYRMRHKDGAYRWIRAVAKITRDELGQPSRLTGIDVDITDQKRLTELQQAGENRLKDFARAVPDISFVIDEDGQLVEVFGTDEALFPLPSKSMRNRTIFEVYPAEMATKLMEDIKRSIDNKSTLRIEHVVEVKKGLVFFVGRVSPMNYVLEGKRLVALVMQDFTERWKAESMLQASYQMRRKSDFLNDLVQGNKALDSEAINFSTSIGLDFSQPLFCCMVRCESVSEAGHAGKTVFSDVTARKDMIMAGIGEEEDRIVWDCREAIGVIYLVREPLVDGKLWSMEQAKRLRETLIRNEPGVESVIGVGGIETGIDGLKKSFRQAWSAMVATKSQAGTVGNVSHFRDLGILQLLAQEGEKENTRDFVSATLGKLIEYDLLKKTGYLLTLEVLLKSDSLKEAAAVLFLHPNTLLFRRRRIEKLLNIKLDDFETRIALIAAIKLQQLGK